MSPRISIRLLATQPDERLIALAREGHERAFEALVRRYRRPLLRYCQRLHLSDARAEDVVQQSLTKAWLALARGVEVHEPRAWLYRIVHNAAVNTIRAAREVPTAHAGALREDATAGESELERTLDVRDALGHVAALPRMQRDAILLTTIDGQSHDEVASALGVSQGAVRGLLYRARTTLRGATAALTPAPLIAWAARGAETAAPSAERLAELSAGAGAGAVGITGALVKGAAVAISVGALATGVAVVKLRHSESARGRSPLAAAKLASASVPTPDAPIASTPEISAGRSAGIAAGPRSTRQPRRPLHARAYRGAQGGGTSGGGASGRVGAGTRRLSSDLHSARPAPSSASGQAPGDRAPRLAPSAEGPRGGESPGGSSGSPANGEHAAPVQSGHDGTGTGEGLAPSGSPPPQPSEPAPSGSGGSGSEESGSDDGPGDGAEGSSGSAGRSDDGSEEAAHEDAESGGSSGTHRDN